MMQARTIRLICAIACLGVAIPVFAQYGYPLKGSWSGDWWLVKGKENHVLLDFNWDGKVLTGTLDPGPDQSPMQKLSLTPPDVINAGKAAIAARNAAIAKQAADATTAPANAVPATAAAPAAGGARGNAPAATAGAAPKAGAAAPAAGGARGNAPAATAGTASKTATVNPVGCTGSCGDVATASKAGAAAATGRGATTAVKDNVAIATDPWLLHFEADAKDSTGKAVHYIVDGKMENLGAAYTRVITGTWKVGTQVGNFKVTRN